MFLLPRNRKSAQQSETKSDSGEEYDPNGKEKDEGASDDSDADKPKRRGRPKSSGKEAIKGFTEAEIRRFIKGYKKFPRPMNRLESVACDAELQEKPLSELKHLADVLQTGCENAVKEYTEKIAQEIKSDESNLIVNIIRYI